MSRRLTALLAVLGAVGVTACGSTTKVVTDRSASNTGTGSGSPSTGTTATGTGTSSTAGAPATNTTAPSPGPVVPVCTAATLRLGYLGGQGATGHGELGFSLTNTSGSSCHAYGYPGVQFLSDAGAPLPTRSTRTTSDFFGRTPLAGITVGAGSPVSFRLGVTHGAGGTAGCTTAGELQVIPPNDTHTLVVKIPGGAYECGTATVSPLQPGTSAFR